MPVLPWNCCLMTSFLFFDGPRSVSEIDFVPQTKRRPDSRPTKHQKKRKECDEEVSTPSRAWVKNSVSVSRGLRGWRRTKAHHHTHDSLIRSVSLPFAFFSVVSRSLPCFLLAFDGQKRFMRFESVCVENAAAAVFARCYW